MITWPILFWNIYKLFIVYIHLSSSVTFLTDRDLWLFFFQKYAQAMCIIVLKVERSWITRHSKHAHLTAWKYNSEGTVEQRWSQPMMVLLDKDPTRFMIIWSLLFYLCSGLPVYFLTMQGQVLASRLFHSIERNSVYLSLKFDKFSSCKDKNLEKWLSCGFHSLQLYSVLLLDCQCHRSVWPTTTKESSRLD